MTNWDNRYMSLALEVAGWSKDPSSKVGALCVSPNRRQFVTGYNGFPVGIEDKPNYLEDKSIKNMYMVHAEVNCIINATVLLEGWTMYVTKAPCTSCAAAMLNARLKRVVCPEPETGRRWFENQLQALAMLRTTIEIDYLWTK